MRNVIIILFLAISAVVAGFYLAPNRKEIALMQLSDAHFKDALQYYSSLWEKGDDSINVLVPLINLQVYYGNIDQAIKLLQSFIAKNPHSVEGHKRLAALYKASQRLHYYYKELEILQELAPSADTLRSLATTYDFLDLHEKEMHALARLVESKNYLPREDDYVKLALLLRVNQQHRKAVKTILAIIDYKNKNVAVDTLYLAVQLLLEREESKKALSLTQAYFGKYGKENDAILLSDLFQQQGQLDSAYAVLEPFLPNIDRSSSLLEQVAMLQLERKRNADVYALLSDQYNKGILPDSLAESLIDMAMEYKNYELAESVIHVMPLDRMHEDALIRYASQWIYLKRTNIALHMQARLGDDYLRKSPLLSALLEMAVNDTAKSTESLLAVPPEFIALPEYRMIVAGILMQRGASKRVMELLNGMTVADMLSALDGRQYAQLFLDENAAAKAAQLLEAARPGSSPELQARMDKALLMLAIGEGKAESVQQWFKDHPDDGRQWLSDGYWMACRYHRNALAQRLYQREPTLQNRMQLTDALLLNHRYAEALADLQLIAKKTLRVRKMYLSVMADWIQREGIKQVPDANRKTLEEFIASMLKYSNMSLDEKRDMAYLLGKAGFRDKAEALFLTLAGDRPFSSPEVRELLGFWGAHPPANAIAWIAARARNSTGSEKAVWLAYLNDAGHPQAVLALLRGATQLPVTVADQYINALVATHQAAQLDAALSQEIDREQNVPRLKKLATIAQQENVLSAYEKGWRKIYSIDPDNAQAARELGLYAFSIRRYTEAGQLLEKYLQNNQGDYRVNYAYAEFLQHQAKKKQAKRYFQQAQTQVSEIKQKNLDDRAHEAHLLYRNNRLEESLALYRELLAEFPDNKTLRADFADVLMEARKFKEASFVLGQ